MLDIPKMLTPEYKELLEKCVHCGLCLEACPTYAVFATEMDAPRGRIALIRAAVDGKITREAFLDTFAGHITLCLECRSCETACPSGVQYGKIIEGARVALEEARQPGLAERLVRWLGMRQLMPHVGQMKALARIMWLYEKLGLQWLVRTVNLLPQPLHAMEGILPPIPSRMADYRKPALAIGEKRGVVTFFYGCIQEAFLGAANTATVRVLQRNGYEVHFPQQQTCCGAAQWHTGDEKLARELALKNIDAFAPYDVVINNAGGCGLTLKEYPDLFHDDPDALERAQAFARKVHDFSEFLYDHLHVPPAGALQVKATYSDSCHLRHGQKVVDQPRELLRRIPGLELVELSHPELCCGSAGIYNIVQTDTSSAVLAAKMDDIRATGADVVVTSNTGCHMQLVSGVRRTGLPAHVLHIAEMLDLSYQADDRRLRERVRHPRSLFAGPGMPASWLAWQDKRIRRQPQPSLASLKSLLQPGQVIDDPVELMTYHVDGGLDHGVPVGVVFPYARADVETIVEWASAHDVPVVARGAGTGLAGGAVALRGALVLAFPNMKQLLELDEIGRSAVVQPGMVNLRLDELVRTVDLYFPPDPASGRAATIGGNIGANAGGPHCFKYGVMTNYVTGMDMVFADGQGVTLGGRALDYPEIDLVGLMTGSEGTLGILTEAQVRLVRNPPAVKTLLAAFESVEQAGEAVSAVIAAGLVPATMEMMGQSIMRLIEEYNHPGLPVHAGAALIIDVDGYPASLQPQVDEVMQVLQAHGALELRVAQSEAERTKIWYARKSAAGAMARAAIDHYTVDGSVPRSLLAETLHEVIAICRDLNLEVLFLLHAGDGNLHPMVLVPDPSDQAFMKRLHESGRRMAQLFVSKGGTITGEHGVGIEKREFMSLMYSADELDAMREIKRVFDPRELLNPDKVFPTVRIEESRRIVHPVATEGSWIAPASAGEAADCIAGAIAAGRRVRVLGGGTKSRHLPAGDLTVSTQVLRGVVAYAPDDLSITVGAGTPLADVQARLAPDGMWVPLQSPWSESTVGGIVSSNFNAPLRMRYGAIRDLVQALTVVLPDGRILRLGRPVMKNVAGYDLGKLFIGSHGALGLIADVTFKLNPLPRRQATLVALLAQMRQGLELGRKLTAGALIASSILLCRGCALPGVDSPISLIYTVEGLPTDVDAELEQVRAMLERAGVASSLSTSGSGSELWASWMAHPLASGLLLRAGVASASISDLVTAAPPKAALMADLANGHCYLRGLVDLAALRSAAHALKGYAVVLQHAGSEALDVWGYRPQALEQMRAIKARWDPQGLFNPGAFIV